MKVQANCYDDYAFSCFFDNNPNGLEPTVEALEDGSLTKVLTYSGKAKAVARRLMAFTIPLP